MPKTIQEIREKTELFFRETLKLTDINKRNGTVNCGYCFMRLDDYIRDGVVHGEIKPVATQNANIFTYPQYESQAGSPLKILSSFTKDKRLLQRCAPLTNKTYNLSLKNGETVEIIDLTVEGTPAPLDQLTLQRVDTLQGQDLITNLKNLPRRAKDGTAYGFILLTWPDKEAHLLNFFVTPKADCSEVFFVDAQAGTTSNSISTGALPDIYFLQSMPPEGFEVTLKKEPVEITEQEQEQTQADLTAPHNAHRPMTNQVVSEAKTTTDKMLNLFKSHYSHLNVLQFYKIWRDRHQGMHGYHWVLIKLQDAGLVPKKTNSPCPPSTEEPDAELEKQPQTKKLQVAAPIIYPFVCLPAPTVSEMLTLFKSHYSHLKNIRQFYEIWRDKHQGRHTYRWVLIKLQDAGLVPKKTLIKRRLSSTISPSSICSPPDDESVTQFFNPITTLDGAFTLGSTIEHLPYNPSFTPIVSTPWTRMTLKHTAADSSIYQPPLTNNNVNKPSLKRKS